MVFDFDKYRDDSAVMICKTREESEMFCRLLHDEGRTWNNGESYLREDHFIPFEGTGYAFNRGQYSSAKTFEESYYRKHYKIYNFSQFDWGKYQSFEPDMVRMESFLSEFRGVS